MGCGQVHFPAWASPCTACGDSQPSLSLTPQQCSCDNRLSLPQSFPATPSLVPLTDLVLQSSKTYPLPWETEGSNAFLGSAVSAARTLLLQPTEKTKFHISRAFELTLPYSMLKGAFPPEAVLCRKAHLLGAKNSLVRNVCTEQLNTPMSLECRQDDTQSAIQPSSKAVLIVL